jgi:hypothetical protein
MPRTHKKQKSLKPKGVKTNVAPIGRKHGGQSKGELKAARKLLKKEGR